MSTLHSGVVATPDRRLELVLRRAVGSGALLVLALPVARGYSFWFGALPLWLLGMPLASWWALHHFRLPRWPHTVTTDAGTGRRRRAGTVQAWRRGACLVRGRGGIAHAA